MRYTRLTTEEFVHRSRKMHGNKYNYDKTKYTGQKNKVIITCPKHGDFEQHPYRHYERGHGCPICSNRKKFSVEEFSHKARKKHGNKYDYSKVLYINNCTPVVIVCPKHGDFEQRPADHIAGKGCSTCVGRARLTKKEFVRKSKIKHGKKYDYSNSEIVSTNKKVVIVCPNHGPFDQTPNLHMNQGTGCPVCAKMKRGKSKSIAAATSFIHRSVEVHGTKYDYSKCHYSGCHSNVTIVCTKHGSFEQTPVNHLQGKGCPRCGVQISRGEDELLTFVSECCKNIDTSPPVQGDRSVLSGKEIDVFVPSLSIGFEFDGLRWHSDEFRDSGHLLEKTEACQATGVRLIHIFEDEWRDRRNACCSRIRSLLGNDDWKVAARDCEVFQISAKERRDFMTANHTQGDVASSNNLGLFLEDELVAVMSFGKARFGGGGSEMLRYATLPGHRVMGGAGKLLASFERWKSPKRIVSYCDLRWGNGRMYEALGFKLLRKSTPSYSYVGIMKRRESRLKYQKHLLSNTLESFDSSISEGENMKANGFYRIYDCGCLVFEKES